MYSISPFIAATEIKSSSVLINVPVSLDKYAQIKKKKKEKEKTMIAHRAKQDGDVSQWTPFAYHRGEGVFFF